MSLAPVRKGVSALGHGTARLARPITRGIRTLLKNILPDEGLFNLPSSTMIFFAVALPLVIAIISGMVYLDRGRAAQQRVYYEQAFTWATQAATQTDSLQQHIGWQQVIANLDIADTFRLTNESKELRSRAIQALDRLDSVTRIDLQPAIYGGLDKSVQVTRMVATIDELYLLDTAHGNVKRAIFTGRGYEIDPSFRCGKGVYGTVVVGSIIGITPLPKGNKFNGTVLGMDENGNRLYCRPGETPLAKPITLPVMWKKPTAVAINLDNLNLFVLDAQANQVWIYQNAETAEELTPFFDQNLPDMTGVIDLAVAGGDLYLLHADSSVSKCTYGRIEEILTRCDPVTYTNLPGGRPDGAKLEGVFFSQIVYAPPPDPSVYLLDSANQAIDHFSLALNFQSQYRSKNPLPDKPAIALAISPKRTVFMAVGNQVYYTSLP
jgi:hypothetical protein